MSDRRSGGEQEEGEYCSRYVEAQKKLKKEKTREAAVNILKMNPEEYMAASIIKKDLGKDTIHQQLDLTAELLSINPKSYNAWGLRRHLAHRLAQDLEEEQRKEAKKKEKQMIQHLLDADPRNTHCWAYLNAVYKYPAEIAQKAISKDPSNYSAFHALIVSLEHRNITAEDMKEVIRPNISSPWMFWRQKEEEKRYNGAAAYVKAYANRLSLIFRRPVPASVCVVIRAAGQMPNALPGPHRARRKEEEIPVKLVAPLLLGVENPGEKQYEVQYEKILTIEYETEGYAEKDIERIEVDAEQEKQEKEGPNTFSIELSTAYTPSPPEFLGQHLEPQSPAALLLLLQCTPSDPKKRSRVVQQLVECDKDREAMYNEMEEPYRIYRAESSPKQTSDNTSRNNQDTIV